MEPVFVNNYGEYIKTKIKSCGDKINTNLCNERKKITKKETPCKFFSLIVLDSVVKTTTKKSIILKDFWKSANTK